MKQLIRKELREQFKVALLGLAVLSVMLCVTFSAYGGQLFQIMRYQSNGNSNALQPLMSSELLGEVAFFCAIFGAVLGWLQIHAERHPDLWAFLMHRPIPRTTILRSKILAGLILYALGAGAPLLVFIIFVAIPGHVAAPFEWAMTLPLVSIFWSGTVSYFAGLLTGLRKARWYASRGFGLGLVVVVNMALFVVPEFWHALLIIAAAGTVLLLAVWGSFQTGGYYRSQPFAGKMALALASAVSVIVLFGVVISFVGNMLASRSGYSYSHYQITKDGKIIKISQGGYGPATDEEADIVYLDGQPVLDETGQKMKLKDIGQRYAPGLSTQVDFEQRSRKRNQVRESFFRHARFFSPWRVQDKTLWYLTSDGRLVAYHGITRRFAGTLLPQGVSSAGAADDTRFLRPGNYGYSQLSSYVQPGLLASSRTAYLVDLEKRDLKPLLTVTNGDAIGGVTEITYLLTARNPSFVLILTRQSIRLMDVAGQTHLLRSYLPSPPEYSGVSVLMLTNLEFAVRFDPDHFLNKESGGKLLTHIDWVRNDGTLRESIDLPKLPDPRNDESSAKWILPFVPLAIPLYPREEDYRLSLLLRFGVALLCVVVGWRLGRRHHFELKENLGWGVFHLLFGIPGLVAFLAVQEWPAREPCPKCGKLRAVNREQCEHCGAEFAPPPKTGIEIFEPLTSV